jgi:hypothetical protein
MVYTVVYTVVYTENLVVPVGGPYRGVKTQIFILYIDI